jgi:hypothetical protein|tara:strand:- start:2031 stop:2495 length:465 start_codon:yes stop_codon:yes gene_type:complete
METFTWNTQFRNRVRLLAGIEQEELDNDTLDILANVAAEWFQLNTNLTFTLNSDNSYDMSVIYYTCYLGCLAQNGVGIDRITVGDLQVYYDTSDYEMYATLANQMLAMKLGLSIKTTTYNAAPYLGQVNWDKNVTGVDATKTMYPPVRGVHYDS